MGISTLVEASGGVNGGGRVAVAVELSSGGSAVMVVEGRNWKSPRRRSAHLLVAEKLFEILLLLAPPLTALSFGSFLVVVGVGGGGGDSSGGVQMPMLRCPQISILFFGD
ncbi:hypothetical protein ACH5RR_027448 [Cinchona calisaya]|uniref:Uncharacterized protein n=1 Tax=Cinchona calisaya TaxID=153742 RepID=A0ABD2Z5I9_9GENT